MLTRRHIRVKVFQTLYAISQTGSEDLSKADKFLEQSCQAYEDLHLVILSIFSELRLKEIEFQDIFKKSYIKTADFEKKLNQKFIQNQAITLIETGKNFERVLEKRKIRMWKDNDSMILDLLKDIKASDVYDKYIHSKSQSLAEDTQFLIDIFEQIIAPSEKLFQHLDDQNLFCSDDYPLINTLVLKNLKKLAELNYFKFPNLFKDEEDAAFGQKLLHKTALNQQTLQAYYEGKTHNWDLERISILDILLLNMALAELSYFPSIPSKVTINEYLEIAKDYSTKNSALFINGLLDALVKDKNNEDKFKKSGRGLINSSKN